MTQRNKLNWKLHPFLAPTNSQAVALLMLGAWLWWQQKNQEGLLDFSRSISFFRTITEIQLASICRWQQRYNTDHESLPLKKKCFERSRSLLLWFFSAKDICTISFTFIFTFIYIWNRVRSVSFSEGGSRTYIIGNLRTTTKFTTTTSVDWEKTGTRTSVLAGKRKLKMQWVGRSTTTTLNVNTNVKLWCSFATKFFAMASFKTMQDLIFKPYV